jgi:HAD superfamily hydrolase (TIGR01490 family)
MYIAFYDLDHTILEDNSATHLVHVARERGIMREKHFRHAVWLSILYKLGIGNSTKMIVRMLSWIRGLKVSEVEDLCEEIFTDMIVPRIRPKILETIRQHRENGGAVVLLSSATEPVCKPVVRHLELDDLICSILESMDGLLTGKTVGKLVYEREKKVRLLEYCREKGHDPQQAYYYGDSFTDRFVMEAVGHPVAVDPDRRLLRIAQRRNWDILLRERN